MSHDNMLAGDLVRLRAELAAVTVERERLEAHNTSLQDSFIDVSAQLGDERAAHAETRKALELAEHDRDFFDRERQREIDSAESARASEATLRERVTNTLQYFREVTAAARRNREPKTGMQVPYHGEFCSATPSVIRDLERFVHAFDEALTADPTGQEGEKT